LSIYVSPCFGRSASSPSRIGAIASPQDPVDYFRAREIRAQGFLAVLDRLLAMPERSQLF
jgi:hypothetical protein